ncbi:Ig-like domain-containing protein [Psychrobacter fjordensis]|uniref:Ig-like domain-containing protein n=1 Tax=Psychrobacter fjordensis TaxID=664424 RepID=UPI0019181A48|nr:Calx-beta domain-containing protein [Psychrobacter fjordensis]
MNTIIIKINDAAQTISQVSVITKDGIPTVITATDNVNYEFFDTAIGHAPNHIITKRLKNDLHVSFEEEGVDSDLIIEGFYDNPDSALVGIAEDGEYYYYIPDTGETYDYVTQLEVGDVEGQALGGEEYIAAAIPWWIPAAAGLGLVGLIAGLASDDNDNNDNDNDNDNAPIAEDDTVLGETGQPITIDVVANDSDSENDLDPTTVKLIDPVTGNEFTSLVVDGEGTWQVDPMTGEVSFTPESGFTADPTPIDYVVSDTNGLQSNQATIVIDYPQTAPIAEDDTVLGETGQPITIDVVANDSDSENDLDPTTVKLIDPVTGNEFTSLVVDGEGTWQVDPMTGEVSFTPESGFTADPTPIDYVVSDTNGLQSNQATIVIDYPQTAPIAEDDTVLGETGQPITIDVVANDSDSENDLDPTTVKLIDPVTGNEFTSLVVDGEGTWQVDPATGEISFTPESGFITDPTPVDYVVSDTNGLQSNQATITADYPLIVSITGTESLSETTVDGSSNEATYTINLSKPSNEDTVVAVTIGGGSTEGSEDYTAPITQTVTIPAGQTSVNVTVPITDDNLFEGPEDFIVTVTEVISGTASVGPDINSVTTTIYDNGTTDGSTPVDPTDLSVGNDTPVVSISGTKTLSETAADGSANEATYTVSLSNPSTEDTIVTVIISDGSTEGSADYTTPVTQDITIPAGQTSVDVTVPITDDNVFEGPENFTVKVVAVTSGTATISTDDDTVSTTIYDDGTTDGSTPVDPNNPALGGDKPVVDIAATKAEAIEGVSNGLVFEVSQNNLSEFPTTVDVKLADSTIEAADIASISYTDINGKVIFLDNVTDIQTFLDEGIQVTIPAGSTSAPAITFTVVDDLVYEQSESLVLEISNPLNAAIGTATDSATIFDEDATDGTVNEGDKPTVTVGDASAIEGDTLVHSVTVNGVTEADVTYDFDLTDGSATAGDYSSDPADLLFSNGVTYDPVAGTITVPAGVTDFTVSYPALNDAILENDETTTLEIGGVIGTGTINDAGDAIPVVNIEATTDSATEGVGDSIVFAISQTGATDKDSNVTATLNLGDIDASDIDSITFTDANGTQTISVADAIAGVSVSIPAGSSILPTFTITPNDDAIYEVSEALSMSISNALNAAIGDRHRQRHHLR